MKYPDWANGIDISGNSEFIAPHDGLVLMTMPSGCSEPFMRSYSDIYVDDVVIAVHGNGCSFENPNTVSFPIRKGTKIKSNNISSHTYGLYPLKFFPYK